MFAFSGRLSRPDAKEARLILLLPCGRNFAFCSDLEVLREFSFLDNSEGLITGRHSWLCAVVAEKRATT